mgnify:CR=1 FL=1
MKSLIAIALASLAFAACSTPSAYTERKFLEGEPDPALKAKDIFDALKRNDTLEKQGVNKATGEKTTWNTNVEISLAPFTPPLLAARAREEIEEKAFKERWDEKKKAAEMKAFLAKRKGGKGEQCFDMQIDFSDSGGVTGVAPAELELKTWYAKVIQGANSKDLTFDTNPTCLITTTRQATTYGISTTRRFYCPTTACTKMALDLTQPFKVEFDIRYEKDLVPLVLEWKGVKQ